MGGFGKTSRKFWQSLRDGGVEVRCYNPPKLSDPLAFFRRDHRKSLIVDGQIAFVSGLCVGQDWVGKPEKNISPWRDTGVEIRGAAVADVEFAFAHIWAEMGAPLDVEKLSKREDFTTREICLCASSKVCRRVPTFTASINFWPPERGKRCG